MKTKKLNDELISITDKRVSHSKARFYERLKIASLSCVALWLTTGFLGFGQVDTVKDAVFDFDKSISVGDALDNYADAVCESAEWESKSENGRDLVEFVCVHNGEVVSRYFETVKKTFETRPIKPELLAGARMTGLVDRDFFAAYAGVALYPEVFDVTGYYETYRFAVNQDDTVSVQEITGTLEWKNGATHTKIGPAQYNTDGITEDKKQEFYTAILQMRYLNCLRWSNDTFDDQGLLQFFEMGKEGCGLKRSATDPDAVFNTDMISLTILLDRYVRSQSSSMQKMMADFVAKYPLK